MVLQIVLLVATTLLVGQAHLSERCLRPYILVIRLHLCSLYFYGSPQLMHMYMKSHTASSGHSEELYMASGKTKMLRTALSVGDSGHDQILHAPSHSISSLARSVMEVTLKAMKPFSLTLNFNHSSDAGVLCHCTLLISAVTCLITQVWWE